MVHIQTTRRHIPEGGSIYNYLCENLTVYKLFKFEICTDLSHKVFVSQFVILVCEEVSRQVAFII
jgi:hypothetical protein